VQFATVSAFGKSETFGNVAQYRNYEVRDAASNSAYYGYPEL
jgi:hypothetical protein